MIIIKHRANTVDIIKNTPCNYGVEIDLRSNFENIYLHHDPFKKGIKLTKWVKFFNHKLIVLNVKEEGLEHKIINIFKKNNITNYFFHDQTFSSLLKNKNKTKVSLRYSEFEELKNYKYLFKNIEWIWIDHFTKFPLDTKFYNILKKYKIKICIVSPELVKIRFKYKIKSLKKMLLKKNYKIDAVCTKYPKLWEK